MIRREVIRLKRWASKHDREQNPFWFNPVNLSEQDVADLGKLFQGKELRLNDLEAAEQAGTIMLIARDTYRHPLGKGPIVGFLSMTITVLPDTNIGLVHQILTSPSTDGELRHFLIDSARSIASDSGVNDLRILESPTPSARRSGVSAIKSAERMDDLLPDSSAAVGMEDGPPTVRLGIPGRKKI